MARKWAIALHGGAGPVFGRDYSREEAHMADLLREGGRRLEAGVAALDVVEAMVAELEASGLHLALDCPAYRDSNCPAQPHLAIQP